MQQFFRYCYILPLFIGFMACGGSGTSSGPSAPAMGPVQTAFRDAAIRYDIPYELLISTAYNESTIYPEPATTLYNAEFSISSSAARSVFGLEPEVYGLNEPASTENFLQQIDSYAAYIRSEIDLRKLSLSANYENTDSLYDWIWFIAKQHRNGTDNRRNVQIVFALELISTINNGFTWQSPDGSERIRQPEAAEPITPDSFSTQIKNNLALNLRSSEIFAVDYMQLNYNAADGRRNEPKKIRIIHCPFSLSACLNIQNQTTDGLEARLGAHYIIPADQKVLPKPIKILQHRVPVSLTDKLGRTEFVDDAVVVMLVGRSGQYLEGQRIISQPMWLQKEQLVTLGNMVRGICGLMREEDPTINIDTCLVPGGDRGVQFAVQGASQTYRWGDIPDFNQDIFYRYIEEPVQQNNPTSFQFSRDPAIFEAGETIQFQLKFELGARKVEIELMESCSNNKPVWSTLVKRYVRDVTDLSVETVLYQAGPNRNGSHFFRALVYDENGNLNSWGIDQIILNNFDEEFPTYSELENCL